MCTVYCRIKNVSSPLGLGRGGGRDPRCAHVGQLGRLRLASEDLARVRGRVRVLHGLLPPRTWRRLRGRVP